MGKVEDFMEWKRNQGKPNGTYGDPSAQTPFEGGGVPAAYTDALAARDAEQDTLHAVLITACVAAILINAVAVAAVAGVKRSRSSNRSLVVSLCCADLLTSSGFLAYIVLMRVMPYHSVPLDQYPGAVCAHKIVQAFVFTGHCATLLSLLALAVDHYCAIGRPLDYPVAMANERVRWILFFFWSLAFVLGFSDFLFSLNNSIPSMWDVPSSGEDPLPQEIRMGEDDIKKIDGFIIPISESYKNHHESETTMSNILPPSNAHTTGSSATQDLTTNRARIHHPPANPPAFEYINYCERIDMNNYEPDMAMFVLVGICLVAMGTLYILIARVLRRQPYAQIRHSSAHKMNVRGLVTTFFILASFALFWLPSCAFEVAFTIRTHLGGPDAMIGISTYRRAKWYLYALIIINALLDPVIYAVRMREVHRNIKRVCCKVLIRGGVPGVGGRHNGAGHGGSGRDDSTATAGFLLRRSGRRSGGRGSCGSSGFGHTRMSMSSSFKSSDI